MLFCTVATLFLGPQTAPAAFEAVQAWSSDAPAPVVSMVAADALGMELHRCHWHSVPPVIQARVETLSAAPPSWTIAAPEPVVVTARADQAANPWLASWASRH